LKLFPGFANLHWLYDKYICVMGCFCIFL